MTYTVYEAMPLSQMLARVQKYYPGDGYKLVEKAYLFAQEAHKNQYRKSGEPYFTHPCFVASILVELSLDPPTIAAGLLHDTVEDCEGITLDTIRQEFGEEVAMLVDGVTKLNKLDFADKEEAQAESLRKMILAMGKDIRVVLIKLADRLHNMLTLKFQKEEWRLRARRWTSMRRLRTGWACTPSSRNWRTCPCATSTRLGTRTWCRRSGRSARSGKKISAWSLTSCPPSWMSSISTTRLTAARSTFTASTAKWCCKTNRSTRFMT